MAGTDDRGIRNLEAGATEKRHGGHGPVTYTLRAERDIVTGDANRSTDRTVPTGLLGSLRWWFEVLVRGVGGSACDPTEHLCSRDHHCVACELFGCTGWARKFRFDVLQESCNAVHVNQIKQGTIFRLRFTPLRPVKRVEWILLDATLRLVAAHGALGAKTKVRKAKVRGHDWGISKPSGACGSVALHPPPREPELAWGDRDLGAIPGHVQSSRFRKDRHKGFEWAAADRLEGFLDGRDRRGDRHRQVLRRLVPPTGETS